LGGIKIVFRLKTCNKLFSISLLDEPPEDSEYVVMGWGRTNNERSDSGNLTVTGSFVNIQQSLVVPEVNIFVSINSVIQENQREVVKRESGMVIWFQD